MVYTVESGVTLIQVNCYLPRQPPSQPASKGDRTGRGVKALDSESGDPGSSPSSTN